MSYVKRKNITFVSPPFAGHFNPQLELAKYIKNDGFDIDFITSENKREKIESLGFAFHSLPSLSGQEMESIANTDKKIGSNPIKLYKQLNDSLHLVTTIKKELSELWQIKTPDVVIADSVTIVPGLIATNRGIPWITTMATPFVLESKNGPPPYMGGLKEGNSVYHKIRDKYGNKVIRVSKKLLAHSVRRKLSALGVSNIYREDNSEVAYSPYAILGVGIKELEFKRNWPNHFQMIGPLFKDLEPVVPLVLPSYPKKILITLGTHLKWAKDSLKEDIKWLSSQRPDILFIGTMGNYEKKYFLNQIAETAYITDFISYQHNLQKFDIIIHHGGAGITNACLYHAKPSLIIPHDYDQFDYAARITSKGLGLSTKKLKSKQTLIAIDKLLKEKNNNNLMQFQKYAKSYDAKKIFTDILNKLCQVN